MQVDVSPEPSKPEMKTMYTADLRQLELKARDARLKAVEAELELEKARKATQPSASGPQR
jgi:hypothetical protein